MIKRKIEIECEKQPQKEVCGFVIEKGDQFDLIAMKNHSIDPENEFYIPAREFLYVKNNNKIVGVYHSHPKGDCKPSDFDLKTADLICYPFIIYSMEKNTFHIHEPEFSDAGKNHLEKLKEELK